ncbi:MAG: class I SAM-dependent methyltransferase [Cyclobacteriaceae bacterium]|nr:class I SAM-dependent methyltransferase [Cyclobacteriaceae bacterium]
MTKIYTTEITSDTLPSDNPIHQRLFKAYVAAGEYIHGNVLEIGCGEGRGVALLSKKAESFTAVDKLDEALAKLRIKFPQAKFIAMNLPPLTGLPDNAFDCVVSFQVIEHIKNDRLFLQEIHRLLKPGGVALITTPNRKMSLTRNPWHVREYLADELTALAASVFSQVEMKGITGNEKVMAYYEQNRQAVRRITRWDILNLQHNLPAWMLRIPYELLNRLNRNNLQHTNEKLVTGITHADYVVTDQAENALDLFLAVRK